VDTIISVVIIYFLSVMGSPYKAPPQDNVNMLKNMSVTFREVASEISPSVVHIKCKLVDNSIGMGSGVIVDSYGFILTSYHVVRNANEISVQLQNRRVIEAEMISFDPLTDLAMLRLKADVILPAAKLGNSNKAEVGDFVLVVGSPLGLQHTVTSGIVSATGRELIGGKDDPFLGYQNFIQTDASIYEGNSGGPLINLDGEVIGIAHASIGKAYSGLSFATPINFIKNVLESMKEGKGAPRGRLGVGLKDLTYNTATTLGLGKIYGAQVLYVKKNSTAADAKLHTGDIIVAINGQEIRNRSHLRSTIACLPLAKPLTISAIRNGSAITLKSTLYGGPTFAIDKSLLGVTLTDLTKVMANQLGLERPQGALIVSVSPKSIASKAKLRPGMVIAGINAMATPDIRAYKKAVEKTRNAESIQIIVNIRGKMHIINFNRKSNMVKP
jgi:serine protease Do